MARIRATVESVGVDWQALREARQASKQAFYERVLEVCQERFRRNKEAEK